MPDQRDEQSFVPDEDGTAKDEVVTTPDEDGADLRESAVDEPDAEAAGGQTTQQAEQWDVDAPHMELEAARERALRLQAELENFRKRAQRNLQEERRYAGLPLIRDLLSVVDNLQRAIDVARQNEGSDGLLEGVEMVAEQLTSILKQHHCEEIPAEGTRFDPNLHEAIAQLPSEECEPGEISQVTQVGYQLHGRVIRPSQVIVAAAKPDAE